VPPYDWERERGTYYKQHATFMDRYHPHGATHARLPELEVLEDELIQAAKERGTRHGLEKKHFPRHFIPEEFVPHHYD
jgi:hypothetical protein